MKPARPYTDYNVFFQVEREWILQNIHGVTPKLDPSEVFDPNDKDYQGPPLPQRYSDLILRKDWYIPGKAQRKKRRHRASHGKIGFCELSKRISAHWSMIDQETKKFCEIISDTSMLRYKHEMRQFVRTQGDEGDPFVFHQERIINKKRNGNRSSKKNSSSKTSNSKGRRANPLSIYSATNEIERLHAKDEVLDEHVLKIFVSDLPDYVPTKTEHFVDMGDEEIIHLWKSGHVNGPINVGSCDLTHDRNRNWKVPCQQKPQPLDEDAGQVVNFCVFIAQAA